MGPGWVEETPDERIQRFFNGARVQITSDRDNHYNCVGHVIGDYERLWSHQDDGLSYWPRGIPKGATIDHYSDALGTAGFEPCTSPNLESGFEKIALFEKDNEFTHVCLLCEDGRWWSKCLVWEDVKHALQEAVYWYGAPVLFMRRRASGRLAPPTLRI